MAEYRLSCLAVTDFDAIAEFSIDRFGVDQARRYRDDLKETLSQLADNPSLGRRAEQLARGLRRFEHGSPIIFYTRTESGILVVRVLHYRMDVVRRFEPPLP